MADEGADESPGYEVMYPDGHLARRREKPKAGDAAMYWRERGELGWATIPLPKRGQPKVGESEASGPG